MLRARKPINSSKEEIIEEKPTIRENFQHYLMNASLHGLKYMGDTTMSLFERCFFVVSFVVVFVLSGYFISNVWQKWSETPIIISINPIGIPLTTIPFPAVTICNMNQARISAARIALKGSLEDSMLDSLCGSSKEFKSNNNSTGRWSQLKRFLMNASQPCSETLIFCRFASKTVPCMDIFWSSLTDDGLCCTFNTVHPDFMFHTTINDNMWELEGSNANYSKGVPIDWTPETGYPKEMPENAFPRQAAGTGHDMGLTVGLNCDVSNYYCSSTNSYGFKILLHAPTQTPKVKNFGFFVAPGTEVRVVVNPRINTASEMIRRVPIEQRQCVFANERNLSYFRTYTQENCEMECESLIVSKQCGCILYYMPKTTADAEICSLKDAKCYEMILASLVFNNSSHSCSCLPACYEIDYERRSSTSPLGVGKFLLRENFLKKYSRDFAMDNIAVVHLYFVENTIHSYTKGELIGFTDFLSSTGGLLGLFMGFSVVSLVEMFYYISMRPHCSKRIQQNPNATQKVTPTFVAWKPDSLSVKRNLRNRQAGMYLYPYCE
ncbi:pickpocket protein 28-like [Phlebotomus papatasi]|uniref:pickpocket protein 28-like n=1 Tax=Phlebotomus papatasi TaxID=29031 RepID=UPI002483C77E|nr:pickpocket protein 28-like [Phlebotomus papatasi]